MTKRRRQALRAAARRGARWLDAVMPGWSRKVKRRRLDLESSQFCILGQIHTGPLPDWGPLSDGTISPFEAEVERLGLTDEEIERLGFDASTDCDIMDYVVLTEAWREELKTRPR